MRKFVINTSSNMINGVLFILYYSAFSSNIIKPGL